MPHWQGQRGRISPPLSLYCSCSLLMAWKGDLLVLSLLGLSLPTAPVTGASCNNCVGCPEYRCGSCDCCERIHKEYVGGDLNDGAAYRKPDWRTCRTSCERDYPTARFFTSNATGCWCKSSNAVLQGRSNHMSGDLNTCSVTTSSTTTPTTTTTTTTTTTGPKSKTVEFCAWIISTYIVIEFSPEELWIT